MCDYCEKDTELLTREVATEVFGEFTGYENISVVYDDRGYLRLGYKYDMQCLDHGENIKINFCPMCGRKL